MRANPTTARPGFFAAVARRAWRQPTATRLRRTFTSSCGWRVSRFRPCWKGRCWFAARRSNWSGIEPLTLPRGGATWRRCGGETARRLSRAARRNRGRAGDAARARSARWRPRHARQRQDVAAAAGGPDAPPGMLVVDIGVAQALLDRPGQLSRLILRQPPDDAAPPLASVAGDALRLVPAGEEEADLKRLTRKLSPQSHRVRAAGVSRGPVHRSCRLRAGLRAKAGDGAHDARRRGVHARARRRAVHRSGAAGAGRRERRRRRGVLAGRRRCCPMSPPASTRSMARGWPAGWRSTDAGSRPASASRFSARWRRRRAG